MTFVLRYAYDANMKQVVHNDLQAFIKKKLIDSRFTMGFLSEKLGISRTTFYRRLCKNTLSAEHALIISDTLHIDVKELLEHVVTSTPIFQTEVVKNAQE